MIDPKMIPDEVVEGYCRHRYGTDWDNFFNAKEREVARRNARYALAAALAAWPNADTTCKFIQHKITGERRVPIDCLRLPLPRT